ncbi:glycoside hydrolase [Aspergillus uvarum CBS 121591]|uniref:Probable glucan endo-1,3-beta-glucosidase eglC n=1 Tax=Aspergillus uvarum CBS 121591 TaxID=1448315 RepID=A0A319BUB5_9EURO|nr:glycoside hydrolase [Aspergillus uvarum CBS 121591]PYH76305.1 glycoside hydrolase [Aspergillus uvarum CBS 121591]
MHYTTLAAMALAASTAEAVSQGFNYGNKKADESSMFQADFEASFKTAKGLVGTDGGFTSARLYTMIQAYSTNTPIEAIPAAIAQDTSLLLGLWTSGGGMANELAALKSAISQYGEDFTKLVVGISVGSEDLYRNSVEGVEADAGVGINPDELVEYIQQVRDLIAGTGLADVPIGHVDTWDSWTNTSNAAVIEAVDWLGFDGYPFWQSTFENDISNAKQLFLESWEKTQAIAGSKEVWMTETGWAVSGDNQGEAVASAANAKIYWDEVGCPLFGNTNTWWYTLQDTDGATPNPSFGVVGSTLSTTPLYDLSCKNTTSSATSTASSSSASATGLSGKTTGSSSSGSGSGSSSSSSSGSSASGSGTSGSGSGSSASGSGASASGSGASASGSGSGSGSGSVSGSWGGRNGTWGSHGNGTYPGFRPSASSGLTPSASAAAGSTGSSGSGSGSSTGTSAAAASSSGLFTGGSGRVLPGSLLGAVVGILALAVL